MDEVMQSKTSHDDVLLSISRWETWDALQNTPFLL
jgi:hypothetical protein